MSSYSHATDDSTVDNVSITVPVSCTMSGTGMNSHNANIINGTYQADIGTTTVKVFCNDSAGFAIYANGYTSNELGKNTLVGSSTSSEIVTGTATSTPNPDVSNWAMKLATISSPTPTYPLTIDNSFGSYSNVPSTYTKVAHRDSATDIGTNAEGVTLTTTYAAYISKTQSADSYSGQVIYTLVHPASETPAQPVACTGGRICYNANTALATGQVGQQSVGDNASVVLYANNFKRDGYGFAGWNTAYDYSGTFYGPNQTITTPADTSTNGLSLYAVWVPSAGVMQGWNSCTSLTQAPTNGTATLASVTALTDTRDNDTYAVARLSDGKCWMIENLRLDNAPELSPSNTHNPSLPLTNTWWYSSTNDSDTKPTSNHLSATTNPTTTAWCRMHTPNCDDQSMLATNNTTLFANNTNQNYDTYGYGNYYNWYSATAGYGKYGYDYGTGYHAPGDICPYGWHIPRGGDKSQESTNEFWSLIVGGINNGGKPANYSSSSTPYFIGDPEGIDASKSLRAFPNNFMYSGKLRTSSSGSSIDNRSSIGFYWSVSGMDSSSARSMFVSNNSVSPGDYSNDRLEGVVIRCIAGI